MWSSTSIAFDVNISESKMTALTALVITNIIIIMVRVCEVGCSVQYVNILPN